VVEGTPLLRVQTRNRLEGSNPFVSAIDRLCCTDPVRDSSRESSVVAWRHEQTDTPDVQDQELAQL
jgi:hypothetical protein